jgi:hypothetical protein
MCLDPEDHMEWYERTKALSTERLHNLDLYWRDNFENSVHQELHSMVQMILVKRGEKTLEMKRQEQIQELNRSLSLSNPFGRVLSGVKSLFTTRTKS